MQLMEYAMASPNINMISFLTRTILDGEITQTYAMRTHLNKVIKADNSTLMDLIPIKIIKRDNPLNLQILILWGLRVMIFVRWWKPKLLTQWLYNKMSCLFNRKQGQVFTT